MEIAKSAAQKNTCYNVRYDVFMNETGYIQDENTTGSEADGFDKLKTTYHFLSSYNGEPAGTVRLILPNEKIARKNGTTFGLPIEELFNIDYYKTENIRVAEISRSSVKRKFRNTKAIFYLWVELINFARSRGITDIISSVNPETDKLCDAYHLYALLESKELVDKKISVNAKKPDIGKVRRFRFPLAPGTCCYVALDNNESTKIVIPQTLKLFTWIGGRFTGEPVYSEKIDMCAMPMNLHLKDIEKTAFRRFFRKVDIYKEVANR